MGAEGGQSKTVVHVLLHPGGGGETYVDVLSRMDGYRFERVFLAPSQSRADILRSVPRSAFSSLRKADLIHVHGEAAAAISLPAIAARRSVVTLHGLHLLRRVNGVKRSIAVANLRLAVRSAGRTICVSEAERPDVLEVVGARGARRLVVIHNGVDPSPPTSAEERAAVRAELGLAPSAVAGIFVGKLVALKDPVTAVRAAADVAREGEPLTLLVAGDGPLRPELERLARGSGAIRLLGHRSDVRRLLAAADFFVLPSVREGLSFALLEAMSHGLPPIVSDAPGNPEAVGDAGIVVPMGDVAGFVTAFRRMLDEPERRALGDRARDRVEHCFQAEEMVRRTREVYDELLRS